jgi:peptidyl-prolyl cis-trans isomerase A (cyclophilin A)/peptidyl-prolyl cis-trans isomerase B (cyclophilin B)
MKLYRSSLARRMGAFFALASLAASAADPERVRVTTNLGAFVVEVQRDRAPLTAENFLGYVKQGYYTNTLFHRVIANFLIQGGGVGPDYKAKPTHKPIPNEAGNGLKNLRGTVGLARASGPHSGDVQFYVNVADNADLDPLPTRWGYAVFGRVVEGMEVVDRISISPTGAAGPFKQDSPLAPVVIQKIELLAASAAPAANPPQANPIPEGTSLEEIVEKAPPPTGGTPTPDESTPPPK